MILPSGPATEPESLRRTCRMSLWGYAIDSTGSSMPCRRARRTLVLAGAHAQMHAARRCQSRPSIGCYSPVVTFRAPMWAPSVTLLAEADLLQRRCAALAVYTTPWPLEDLAALRRRTGRVAAVSVSETRPWSRRIIELAAALVRAFHKESSGESTCAGGVFALRSAAWLEESHAAARSESLCAGRIGARIVSGRVAPRYKAIVSDAARLLGAPL